LLYALVGNPALGVKNYFPARLETDVFLRVEDNCFGVKGNGVFAAIIPLSSINRERR
jgi:hypothetical protein